MFPEQSLFMFVGNSVVQRVKVNSMAKSAESRMKDNPEYCLQAAVDQRAGKKAKLVETQAKASTAHEFRDANTFNPADMMAVWPLMDACKGVLMNDGTVAIMTTETCKLLSMQEDQKVLAGFGRGTWTWSADVSGDEARKGTSCHKLL
jgi:hypothetical protein